MVRPPDSIPTEDEYKFLRTKISGFASFLEQTDNHSRIKEMKDMAKRIDDVTKLQRRLQRVVRMVQGVVKMLQRVVKMLQGLVRMLEQGLLIVVVVESCK